MKIIIDKTEYVPVPEIERTSCNGCTFYRTGPGAGDACKVERKNEVFVHTNADVIKFNTRICSSNEIIWLKSKESIVKQQEQTYTESQIIQALENWPSVDVDNIMRDIKKFTDPEYIEYVRLREKFGYIG